MSKKGKFKDNQKISSLREMDREESTNGKRGKGVSYKTDKRGESRGVKTDDEIKHKK